MLAACLGAVGLGRSEPHTSLAATVTIPIGGRPIQSVAAGGTVWVLTCDRNCRGTPTHSAGRLIAVDAATARTTLSVPVSQPTAMAFGQGSLWLTHFWDGAVTRVNPSTGATEASIKLPIPRQARSRGPRFLPGAIAASGDTVWVTTARGLVAEINPQTNRVSRVLTEPPGTTGPAAATQSGVWIAGDLAGVLRIGTNRRERSGEVRATVIRLGANVLSVTDILTLGRTIWALGTWSEPSTDSNGHVSYTLTRRAAIAALDEQGRIRSVTSVPSGGTAMTTDHRSIWIGGLWYSAMPDTPIDRFSPTTRRITGRQLIRRPGSFVAVQRGAVWITK